MKTILLIAFSNMLFAQLIPPPNPINIEPPTKSEESVLVSEELQDALLPFLDTTKYGLGIIKYNATGDEFSTGATFKIFNPSKKTIKYIWFTVAGENPVGDLVKTGTGYYKTLKGIGPIEPKSTGEWRFDYVFLTNIIETLRLSTIKIQYMDLSIRTIKYNYKMYIGESAYEDLISALNKKETLYENKEKRNVSVDDQNIFSDVDQAAEFPGGIGAFRNIFNSNFNMLNMLGRDKGVLKAEISFVVEKDGSISDIKATGSSAEFNDESIRTVSSIEKKWSPAKINSVPVRSRFRLPMTMNIEE